MALAPSASAQSRDEAGRRYGQAVAAFEAGDFATALAGFQETYVRSRRPEVLINVAVCYQRLGRREEALTTYRNYLSLSADSPNRATIESTVAQLERELAAASPVAPVAPTPAPPPPPVVAPPPAPLWPWIALGTGAALTVGGALLLALPSDPGSDTSLVDEGAYLAARDQRSTLQITGAAVGLVGLAAATVGVIAVVTREAPRANRTAFDLRVSPLAGGALVGLSGAF
jgi:tetratricopeptide (TPR) repeat protein